MILGIDASQANRKVRSGTEWYAFHLIEEFKKLLQGRYDIRVVLYLRSVPQADLLNNLPDNFSVKILHWPLKYFWGQIRLSWEMLTNPPDTLFCPAHAIPLIHPVKTFTTLHDVGFEDYPELYDKLSLWYHRFSARLAVKKAFHIFTVSEFSKSRIVEVYDCRPEKITVTYLGCDPSPSLSPRQGRGEGDYILFLGRIEPKKNIGNIVKAYEKFIDAGSESGMTGVNIPDLILAGPVINLPPINNPKIKILGYIKEEEKPALYQGTAIFLFPTLYEGFGLPILEAQSYGIPVITSNTASNPEVAGQGAVIVDPESPYEIAEAIKELLTNRELREEKIRLGFENVRRFSWQETARKTYEKIFSHT